MEIIQRAFLFIGVILSGACLFLLIKVEKNTELFVANSLAEHARQQALPSGVDVPDVKVGNIMPAAKEATKFPLPEVWDTLIDKSVLKVFYVASNDDFGIANSILHSLEIESVVSTIASYYKNDSRMSTEDLNALNNMDVFLILYTSNYRKNPLANQFFGFAVAKSIPIIAFVESEADIPDAKIYSDEVFLLPADKSQLGRQITDMVRIKKPGPSIKSVKLYENEASKVPEKPVNTMPVLLPSTISSTSTMESINLPKETVVLPSSPNIDKTPKPMVAESSPPSSPLNTSKTMTHKVPEMPKSNNTINKK